MLKAFCRRSFQFISREFSVQNGVPAIKPLKVVVGLSGGVDSSVTALLLQQAGFEVHCCFMRNWDVADEVGAGLDRQPCTVEADYGSAAAVASHLGLPLTRVDFTRQYWSDVFEPMLQVYAGGRTPNPDASCNRFIKFGAFRDHALQHLGADVVATGHWASLWPAIHDPMAPLPAQHQDTRGGTDEAKRVVGGRGGIHAPQLCAAVDGSKDQSDFLSIVSRSSLRRVMFPLGTYTKVQARALALAAGLPTATRKDSTGLCFIGKRKLGPFLQGYLEKRPGTFVDVTSGMSMGECKNPLSFTIGQRARIAGQKAPYFVAGIVDTRERANGGGEGVTVNIARGQHHPTLYCDAAVMRLDQVVSCGTWLEDLRHEVEQCGAAQDPHAVAAWLRSSHAPTHTPSVSICPPSSLPCVPVLYRDRHRQEDLHEGSVTVCRTTIWREATKLLAQGCGDGHGHKSLVSVSCTETVPWVIAVKFYRPHRAVAPGQVLVLYARNDVDQVVARSSQAETLVCGPWSVPLYATVSWNGAGRRVLCAGPIEACGPSWAEQGCTWHSMPMHLQQKAVISTAE